MAMRKRRVYGNCTFGIWLCKCEHINSHMNLTRLVRGFRYLAAFLVWNIEIYNCESIRSFRQDVGYPLRVISELHAWWHVGTCLGTYGAVLLTSILRCIALGRKDVCIRWLGFGLLPFLAENVNSKKYN